ncbi:hypothetical protein ACHAXR_006241 [Thalassiosira sp. AJA248-18]
MDMSTELAPLGGMLDSVLGRLAALEKVADAAAPPSIPPSGTAKAEPADQTPQHKTSEDDAALIESLQSEISDLRTQLENAQKYSQRLERQLANAGIKAAEDIPFDVAKSKVKSIAERMQEIGSANVEVEGDEEKQKSLREEYFVLEREIEKYNNALLASDEYIEEGRSKERQWENDVSKDNHFALMCIRRHMPPDIKNYSEAQLTTEPTPNGKYLLKAFAQKFKRCNVLQLLRMDPESIARSHPASLENLRDSGMTLTERRAVYYHLTESQIDGGDMTIAETWEKNRKDAMVDRKFTWYSMMRDNLKSALRTYEVHVQQCGSPDNHECDLIGNQCPVRADRNVINYYEEDYGFPEGDVYQQVEKAASVSLTSSPEKMSDPKQLSGDRVKEELRNQKRLAYEDWKKTYEKEYKIYTEIRAAREVKLEELEKQIEEYKAEEVEYEEEHRSLKRELSALPRGSRDRLPLMKKVNVTMTQCKEAKRRSAAAMEELEELRAKMENEKQFVCSMAKPDWVQDDDNDFDEAGVSHSASPPSNGDGVNVDFRRHSMMGVQGNGNSDVDSNRRHSTNGIIPGRAALLAAIQGQGQADGRGSGILGQNGRQHSNGVAKNALEPIQDVKEEEGQGGQGGQDGEQEDVGIQTNSAKNGVCELPRETAKGAGKYARKPSNDRSIARESQLYKRSSGGKGVNKTTLLSCPPPMENVLSTSQWRMRKEKEALELKMRKQEEAEKLKTAAIEKARADAAERAERLRKEKEKRAIEEARQREEAERKERERQELLSKQREEEERKRRLAKEAKEAEKKRSLDDEKRRKEEQERMRQDKVATFEQRIEECMEEVAQHEEMMLQFKAELKEIPRGAASMKDRVAKMKEINQAQQSRGEAKKAAVAAQDELDAYLRSK